MTRPRQQVHMCLSETDNLGRVSLKTPQEFVGTP